MKLEPEPQICIIGAGLAGLCAGIRLKETLDFTRFTIFETNSEVGGTWSVNVYPGCCCDVPSHFYSFSFAPKADWSKRYSSQAEILEYLKVVTKEHSLYPHIRFQTRVESLHWNPQSLKWIATVHDTITNSTETLSFDIVINGSGMLRIPNYPEEFKNFTGELIHSAEWNPNLELTGKRVGVVGTGASAIQIVPAIVDRVDKLTVFQRRAPYLLPKIQYDYPQVCKWAFAKVPGLMWFTRAILFCMQELQYIGFQHNSIGAKIANKISAAQRAYQISNDQALKEKMTPEYEIGCKRILPSNEYYPAIQKPNVEIISSKKMFIEEKTIWTDDGVRTDLDVLILATGYKPHEYFAPMTIIGKNSEDILHTWKTEEKKNYLSTVCSSLPNYFSLMGPHASTGHTSLLFLIECQVEWMVRLLQEMQKKKVSYFNLKNSAEDDFMQFYKKGLSKTVWGNQDCGSWYANPKGNITALWPLTAASFWRLTSGLNTEVFDFK